MSSDAPLEIRLLYMEDLVARLNLIIAEQRVQLDVLSESVAALKTRLGALESNGRDAGGAFYGGPSEAPPDGVNR